MLYDTVKKRKKQAHFTGNCAGIGVRYFLRPKCPAFQREQTASTTRTPDQKKKTTSTPLNRDRDETLSIMILRISCCYPLRSRDPRSHLIGAKREITDQIQRGSKHDIQNLSNPSHRLWNSTDGTARQWSSTSTSFVQDAGMLLRLLSRTQAR